MTSTSAPTDTDRGAGTKVHRAVIYQDRIIGTGCAVDTLAGGRQALALRKVAGPADCKKCAKA
jgi:hypothetical protein